MKYVSKADAHPAASTPMAYLNINEEQAEVVRLIYKWFLSGYSHYKIGKKLTELGIPTPAGKKTWYPSSVLSILKNEKYKGDALLQKEYTMDFLTKKRKKNEGEVPQYYVTAHHEAIVTKEEFDKVQMEIEKRKSMGRYSGVGIFSSKIKCGECGGWYGSKVWHSTDKYRKVIYRCNHKYESGCKCQTSHITEEELKELFLKVSDDLYQGREGIIADIKAMMKIACDTKKLEREQDDYATKLNVVNEQMQMLIASNSRVAQDQNEYQRKYDELA